MKNFLDSILIFIVNGIFGGSHPGFFLKLVVGFRYAWGTPVGDSFPVKLQAVCLLFWWKWAPSWVFFKFFAYYYYYYYFMLPAVLGELTLVAASYTWKETFLESTLHSWIFDK